MISVCDIVFNILNEVHSGDGDCIVSREIILERYKVSEGSYYKVMVRLKKLNFIDVVLLDGRRKKVQLRNKK